jgi:hypothetical protein
LAQSFPILFKLLLKVRLEATLVQHKEIT